MNASKFVADAARGIRRARTGDASTKPSVTQEFHRKAYDYHAQEVGKHNDAALRHKQGSVKAEHHLQLADLHRQYVVHHSKHID